VASIFIILVLVINFINFFIILINQFITVANL